VGTGFKICSAWSLGAEQLELAAPMHDTGKSAYPTAYCVNLGKRPLNYAIDFQAEVVAVYAVFGSTSCQGSNASKSSTVFASGN
jgi:hypothetical protein